MKILQSEIDNNYKILTIEHWPNNNLKYVRWTDGEEHHMNQDGLNHRVDGPAIIYANGKEEFWLNGKQVNSLEELIIKNIIE